MWSFHHLHGFDPECPQHAGMSALQDGLFGFMIPISNTMKDLKGVQGRIANPRP